MINRSKKEIFALSCFEPTHLILSLLLARFCFLVKSEHQCVQVCSYKRKKVHRLIIDTPGVTRVGDRRVCAAQGSKL